MNILSNERTRHALKIHPFSRIPDVDSTTNGAKPVHQNKSGVVLPFFNNYLKFMIDNV